MSTLKTVNSKLVRSIPKWADVKKSYFYKFVPTKRKLKYLKKRRDEKKFDLGTYLLKKRLL